MKPIYRHFDLRTKADSDGMTITGIGVPYDCETEIIPGYCERFAAGSVNDDGAILRYGHSEPLGVITAACDTPKGREITARISDTPRGRDIATLIRDGVLSKLSIGFYIDDHTTQERDGTTHVTITKARAVEYSVVEFPAYEAAAIVNIRNHHPQEEKETPTMTTSTVTPDVVTRAEFDTLNTGIDDLSREVRNLAQAHAHSDEDTLSFRSIGEYAKALAAGDELAKRAFDGAVIGQTIARPAWLGLIDKHMTAKMHVTNLFNHTMDLPDAGMTIEYAKRKDASTVTVGKQNAEGTGLTKGKPGTYEVKSAPVATYGGYGEMSLQAIERATISLLDDLLYDQALMYATEIEKQTRALFQTTVTNAEKTPLHTIANLAQATVDDWTDIVLTLIEANEAEPVGRVIVPW